MKQPKRFDLPAAVVLVAMIVCLSAIYLWAPSDERPEALLGAGTFFGLVLAFLRQVYGAAAIAVLVIATSAAAIGCGGPPAPVTRALNVATRGLLELDRLEAPLYAEAHAEALASSTTRAAYEAEMRPHIELERYMRFTLRELATLDAAFRAWSAADQEDWTGTAACVALGLERSVRGAEALDLDVPDELGSGLQLLNQFATLLCPRALELEE